MEITHKIKTSAQSLSTGTAGFDIETNCHSLLIDNLGSDDVKVDFNHEPTYYLLKSGSGLPLNVDGSCELLRDVIKLEFVTETAPLVNILRQKKSIIE